MQFDEVRRLIRLVEESDVDELDIWRWWGRIRIRKNVGPTGTAMPFLAAGASPAPAPAPVSPESRPAAEAPAPAAVDDDAGLVPVKSPMVGTVYRAPAPDADPYVQNGDMIEVGQTVCIVEAMKLMNEIQSEVRGKVVRVLVDNAQPVEFGQALFLIQEM
jgi:acetyl-CoA carboxylase biotin carboxyl carrier protein